MMTLVRALLVIGYGVPGHSHMDFPYLSHVTTDQKLVCERTGTVATMVFIESH